VSECASRMANHLFATVPVGSERAPIEVQHVDETSTSFATHQHEQALHSTSLTRRKHRWPARK
jgi:hypothetical protein